MRKHKGNPVLGREWFPLGFAEANEGSAWHTFLCVVCYAWTAYMCRLSTALTLECFSKLFKRTAQGECSCTSKSSLECRPVTPCHLRFLPTSVRVRVLHNTNVFRVMVVGFAELRVKQFAFTSAFIAAVKGLDYKALQYKEFSLYNKTKMIFTKLTSPEGKS